MACALCGKDACRGHTSNRTVPVGYGMFGPEPGPPTGLNRGYPHVYTVEDGMYTAAERLYLDKDGNLVREGDPTKASLLVGVGGQLSDEDAARYGLLDAPAEKAKSAPTENKAVSKAPANKSGE